MAAGVPLSGKLQCLVCLSLLIKTSQSLLLLFLCRRVVHARCAGARGVISSHTDINRVSLTARIARTAVVKARLNQGCPVCFKRGNELTVDIAAILLYYGDHLG